MAQGNGGTVWDSQKKVDQLLRKADHAAKKNGHDPSWQEFPPEYAYENEETTINDEASDTTSADLEDRESLLLEGPIDWSKLAGDPPARTWWMQDWLGPDPTLVAGAGGTGKSLLLQALGTSLATGRRYLVDTTRPLQVLIWSCEDDREEVWRRQVAINAHLDLGMADLSMLHIEPRRGLDNTLLHLRYGTPEMTPLFFRLRQQVNDLKADVLVLDNIAHVYGGQDEKHQVTHFVNQVAGLVKGRPFAPILLGHVARAQGSEYSGNAAWENAVRMRWYLGRTLPGDEPDPDSEPDADVVYLARRKANYSSKDWRRLRYRNGLLVPDDAPENGVRFDQSYRNEAAERVVLTALPRLKTMGLEPSDKAQSHDYLPKQIIAKGLSQNHERRELKAAMDRLMSKGSIRRDVIGAYSNRSPKYGLVMS